MERKILLNPGPATTTDSVKTAQVVSDICPREKEFGDVMREVSRDLLRIVKANPDKYCAVLFCGSGTLNMDVCINSLIPANKKILVINNGSYSSRAVDICKAYGLHYIDMKCPVDKPVDIGKIREILQNEPNIAAIYTTHHETGTGVLNPIREIGAVAHEFRACFIADTTSSYAMIPIDMKKDNIDFCMASAQKGIQGMTGLSFVIGRTDLTEESRNYPVRSYYCNLYKQYEYFKNYGQMRFTPPVQTIYAAKQALKEYFAEGELAKWERHKRIISEIHNGVEKLGLKEIIERRYQSGLVVAIKYPEDKNWDFDKIHDYCYERGYTIYPGKMQEHETFRLCALGAIDGEDIKKFFTVFEEGLKELGVDI